MNFSEIVALVRVGVAVLVAFGAFFGLIWSGVKFIRRKHKIRTNPLDPALRKLIASDISWENCAMCPDFCEKVLPTFRFLTDELGFSLPRIEPNARFMHYRREEIGLTIGEAFTAMGEEVIVGLVLYRTGQSNVVLNEQLLGSKTDELGDGYRGVAFYLKANLDRMIADLKGVG